MSHPFYSTNDLQNIKGNYGALLWELHQGAAYGDIDRVRECLDAGADINGQNPDFGVTALMLAAAGGYLEIGKLLLDRGADSGIVDRSGRAALDWAIYKHWDDFAELIRGRLSMPKKTASESKSSLRMGEDDTNAPVFEQTLGNVSGVCVKCWRDEYREVLGAHLYFDCWRPSSDDTKKLPFVILVHGGGWDGGDRNDPSLASIGNALLAKGFAVATIDYRLAWTWRFPDPLADLKAAVRYFRANADEYGIDPERIGVFGHSAGAHLALLLGLTSAAHELEKFSGDASISSSVRAVCGISCPCDFKALIDVGRALRDAVNAGTPSERKGILSSLKGQESLSHILSMMDVFDFPLKYRDLSEKETALLWQRKFDRCRPVRLVRGLVHVEDSQTLLEKEDDLLRASPMRYAQNPQVDGPAPSFLLLHGANDPVVSADECYRFQSVLREHKVDVDIRTDQAGDDWHCGAADLVFAFFERTLKSCAANADASHLHGDSTTSPVRFAASDLTADMIYEEKPHESQTLKKESDEMQALNSKRQEILEPLEGLRSLVRRPDNGLADSRAKEIECDIDKVKRSICYDRYRVTVFGAFSAGKSTLLNALMGAEYLPSADLPTTNITTEIFRSEQFYVFMPNCDVTKAQARALQNEVSRELPGGTFLENLERDGQTISGIGVGFQPHDSKGFRQVIAQLASEQSCHEKGLSKFKKRIKAGRSTVLQLGIPNLPEWLGEITLTDAPGAGSVYKGHESIIDDIIPKTQLVLYVVESPKAGSSVDEWLCNRIVNNCHRKVFFILNKIDQQNSDEIDDALSELKEHIPSIKVSANGEPTPPRPEFLKTSALFEEMANRLSNGSATIADLIDHKKLSISKLLVSDEWTKAGNDQERKDAAIRYLREQSQFDKLLERIKSYLHEENKELPFCDMAAGLVKDCGQELEDVCGETIATIQAEKSEKELEEKRRELHRLRESKAKEARRVLEEFRESALRPETGILSKVENDLAKKENNLAAIPDTVTEELEKTLNDNNEFKRLTADDCKELNNWLTAKVVDYTDLICQKVNSELEERGAGVLAQLRPIFEEIDNNTLGRQFKPVSQEEIGCMEIDESSDSTVPTIVASAAGGAATATALGVAFGGGAGLAGLAGSAGFGVLAGKLAALGLGTVGLGLGPIILIAGVVVGIIAFFMPGWWKNIIRNKILAETRSKLAEKILGNKDDSLVKKLNAKIEEFVNGYVDEYSNKLKKSLKDMDDQEEQIIANVAKARNDKQTRIRTLESFRKEVKSFVESSIQTLRELNPGKEAVRG